MIKSGEDGVGVNKVLLLEDKHCLLAMWFIRVTVVLIIIL